MTKGEHKEKTNNSSSHSSVRSFFQKGIFLFIVFIIFSAVLTSTYIMNKSAAKKNYLDAIEKAPGLKWSYNPDDKVLKIVEKYGLYAGLVFSLLSLVGMYVLFGIAALFKLTKYKLTIAIISLVSIFPWILFGFQLVFKERRFSTISNSIIFFEGYPLFYSSIIMSILIILIIIFLIFKGGKNE